MQTALFWLTGGVFFAVQLATLVYLLYARRTATTPDVRARQQAEVVWTLVPAAVVAVLALMLGGLVDSSWSGTRRQKRRPAIQVELYDPGTGPSSRTGNGDR